MNIQECSIPIVEDPERSQRDWRCWGHHPLWAKWPSSSPLLGKYALSSSPETTSFVRLQFPAFLSLRLWEDSELL